MTVTSPSPQAPARLPVIALVGNPNTGKSTVFNCLCGARQKVGNYPGVTIDRKFGEMRLPVVGAVEVVDLPGTYSLRALSPDEQVVTDFLMGRFPAQKARPDLILFILDATNLKRNLFLLSQVAEIGLPVVVCLTMTDMLEEGGIELDLAGLEKELQVPVVAVVGRREKTVDRLRAVLDDALRKPPRLAVDVEFPKELETIVRSLAARDSGGQLSSFEIRNLLFFSKDFHGEFFAGPAGARELESARAKAKTLAVSPARVLNARYQWADRLIEKFERRGPRKRTWSERIDRLAVNRLLGPLLFAGVMYLVFQSIYTWAAPFMDLVDLGFGFLGEAASLGLESTPMLRSLIVDGIIAGVGSVVIFLPQIIFLFFFVALLEDSGYLARAAFFMDRLLGWTGLSGRSFIPMLSSFACAIPGVMSARVIPDPRVRLTTILVSPLMSCSARLPVYLLLIGAFIEPVYGVGWAAFTLFAMHALGLVVALPVAWGVNRGLLKTPSTPFVLELPPYRLPHWRNVFFRVYEAAKKFLTRAGTIIFALSIVIWALSYFPRPDALADRFHARYAERIAAADGEARETLESERDRELAAAYLEQSVLGRMGQAVQPIFAPLGYDWKITVGILGAFPAREVIIATLGILYSVGDDVDEESESLKERMTGSTWDDGRPVFTPLVTISLMVFFALCAQCMSTIATVQRELKSWGWAIFMFVYMTGLAYLAALLVMQAGLALGFR